MEEGGRAGTAIKIRFKGEILSWDDMSFLFGQMNSNVLWDTKEYNTGMTFAGNSCPLFKTYLQVDSHSLL